MLAAAKHLAKRLLRQVHPTKSVQFEGMTLKGAIEDYGFLKALAENAREPYTVDLFKRQIQPGDRVIDVGAHLGHYTLLAGQCLRGRGQVLAFEPHQRNRLYLAENVAANGLGDIVKVLPNLVAEGSRSLTFYADEFQSDCSSTVKNSGGSGAVTATTVQAVSLDEVIGAGPLPAVIKVDVEGAELAVLGGLKSTLQRLRAQPQRFALFIECNPEALRRGGSSAVQLVEILLASGLKIERIDEQAKRCFPVGMENASNLVDCENFLCRML